MSHILIIGGAGFIGSNAARYFLDKGHEVSVVDTLQLGVRENLDPRVRFFEIADRDMASHADIGTPDYIIHLAGSSSSPMFKDDLKDAYANNILGHASVLEFAHANGVKKVLFASSSSIYGNIGGALKEDMHVVPPNHYSVTKFTQEGISRAFSLETGMPIVAFRFMSVYGPQEEHKGRFANLVSQFVWGMQEGRSPVIYGDGTQTRDFTYVDDIVSAFEKALNSDKGGFEIYNVGTSESHAVRDVIALINSALGTQIEPLFIENPIGANYIMSQESSLEKIERELGYAPTVALGDGIRRLVEVRNQTMRPYRDLSY
jgi:UDP-glucose 4-epimerase